VQVSSFGNYIAEEDFKNTFMQQSRWKSIILKSHLNNNLILMATGYSCRSQVALQDNIYICHPVQILVKLFDK